MDTLSSQFSNKIHLQKKTKFESVFNVEKSIISHVVKHLKTENYNILLNLTAVDYDDHFELIYHFLSMKKNSRFTIITDLQKENTEINSIVSIFPNANWYEREIYDLFGIAFKGHPNLTRIMLPDDWQGHPLRKDYCDEDMIPLNQ